MVASVRLYFLLLCFAFSFCLADSFASNDHNFCSPSRARQSHAFFFVFQVSTARALVAAVTLVVSTTTASTLTNSACLILIFLLISLV
jgi:hypothetical protein